LNLSVAELRNAEYKIQNTKNRIILNVIAAERRKVDAETVRHGFSGKARLCQ